MVGLVREGGFESVGSKLWGMVPGGRRRRWSTDEGVACILGC